MPYNCGIAHVDFTDYGPSCDRTKNLKKLIGTNEQNSLRHAIQANAEGFIEAETRRVARAAHPGQCQVCMHCKGNPATANYSEYQKVFGHTKLAAGQGEIRYIRQPPAISSSPYALLK